ncbi:hypothetical protein E2C01_088017 [Portunus trituberculatus]|uniref:Uncharacterized protein n=1 Tax=Portunus trituberculatus TaxID=210409 RepID=A0A5B7JKV1_PORTR|nr:hypothetical protein [Portunus trituberculatus]
MTHTLHSNPHTLEPGVREKWQPSSLPVTSDPRWSHVPV